MEWLQIAPSADSAPKRCEAAGAAVVGRKVYVFGGLSGENMLTTGPEEGNDLHVLDLETRTWTKPAELTGTIPAPRTGHTLSAVGTKLYLFGGMNSESGYLGETHVLDTSVSPLTWTKPIIPGVAPSARDKHAVCVWGEKLVVYGGFGVIKRPVELDEEDEEAGDERSYATFGWYDDVFVLDTVANHWDPLVIAPGVTPSARAACSFSLMKDDTVHMFGGRDATSRQNDHWSLNLVTGQWNKVVAAGCSPSRRSFHGAASFEEGKYLVLFGGLDASAVHHNDLFVFDVVHARWFTMVTSSNKEGCSPSPRGNMAITSLGKELFVFGGSSNWDAEVNMSTKFFNDVYTLDCADLQECVREQNAENNSPQRKRAKTTDGTADDAAKTEVQPGGMPDRPAECKQQ